MCNPLQGRTVGASVVSKVTALIYDGREDTFRFNGDGRTDRASLL